MSRIEISLKNMGDGCEDGDEDEACVVVLDIDAPRIIEL
jgi:hypothetical protein